MHGRGLPVYVGRYNLRGYGLGGTIMSNIFKYAIPLLKPIAKKILGKVRKEAIRTGQNIAQDVFINKQNPKSSIKKRAKEAYKRMTQDNPEQSGSGRPPDTNKRKKPPKEKTLRDIFNAQGRKRKTNPPSVPSQPRKKKKRKNNG